MTVKDLYIDVLFGKSQDLFFTVVNFRGGARIFGFGGLSPPKKFSGGAQPP